MFSWVISLNELAGFSYMGRPDGIERQRAEEMLALAERLEKVLMRREAHVQETLKIVRARIRDLDDFLSR